MTPRALLRTSLIVSLFAAGCGCADESAGPAPRPEGATSTVVVVSLDTLRPERMGVYGGAAGVSPVLDLLAKEAVVFDSALAPAPWTLPSHMSLFTGLDPVAHGVRFSAHQLSPNALTLAETLKAAGFDTAAFTDGGFMSKDRGFEQGFDLYDDAKRGTEKLTGFARYLDRALEWMRARGDDPYFLFLHTFDIHAPYAECDAEVLSEFRQRPTPDGPRDFQLFRARYSKMQRDMGMAQYGRMSELLNDYDAGIHEADRSVGRVIEQLKASGRWNDALFVVLSDHGESFLDHGLWIGHGLELTDDEIKVPLLVKFPRALGGGTRVDTLVDLLDVMPTVLASTGVGLERDHEPRLQGEDLGRLVRGEQRARSFVFGGTANTESYFLVRGGYKFITPIGIPPMSVARGHVQPETPPVLADLMTGVEFKTRDQGIVTSYPESFDPLGVLDGLPMRAQLFDRAADPGELHNLAEAQPDKVKEMTSAVLSILKESNRIADTLNEGQKPRVVTPHEQRQLNQLGYAETPTQEEFEKLSKQMKDMLKHPHVPPDMCALFEADARVHEVRLALREKRPVSAAQADALRAAGAAYVAWAEKHAPFFARAQWRLLELQLLAEEAEVELPQFEKWRRAMLRTGKSSVRDKNAAQRAELGVEKGELRKATEKQRTHREPDDVVEPDQPDDAHGGR